MARLFRRAQKKIALPPGTVEFTGERKIEKVRIDVVDFDEKRDVSVEDCLPLFDTKNVSWIDVTGLHDTGVLKKIGEKAGLHPLVLEDIVHTNQRPKVED